MSMASRSRSTMHYQEETCHLSSLSTGFKQNTWKLSFPSSSKPVKAWEILTKSWSQILIMPYIYIMLYTVFIYFKNVFRVICGTAFCTGQVQAYHLSSAISKHRKLWRRKGFAFCCQNSFKGKANLNFYRMFIDPSFLTQCKYSWITTKNECVSL